jgi:hypothetical protein
MKIMATEDNRRVSTKKIIFQHRIDSSLGNSLKFNPATKPLNYSKALR